MRALVTILGLLLTSISAPALAAPIPLKDAVDTILKGNPDIVIVGEDHQNPGLARGILDLLKALRTKDNFNCLFIEVPADLQAAIDREVAEADLAGLTRVIVTGMDEAYLNAYARAGADAANMAYIRQYLIDHAGDPMPEHPYSSLPLLQYLKQNKIALVGFDAPSSSQEYFDATYVRVKEAKDGRSDELDVQELDEIDRRNKTMTENILFKSRQYNCKKKLLVIGSAHLYSYNYMRDVYGSSIAIYPLQEHLNSRGVKTSIVVAKQASGKIINASFTVGSDNEDLFDSLIGHIQTP